MIYIVTPVCKKKYIVKCDIIINELISLLTFLPSAFQPLFFPPPATRSPQHSGELKHLFNPTSPISHPTPQDQTFCSKLFGY